jgi:hypothetical protein
MSHYRLHGRVVSAKVSDLPWPDLSERYHIDYRVVGIDNPNADDWYEISFNYPRGADLETVSVEGKYDGETMTLPDWMCRYAIGKAVYLDLDENDEPVDLTFIESEQN